VKLEIVSQCCLIRLENEPQINSDNSEDGLLGNFQVFLVKNYSFLYHYGVHSWGNKHHGHFTRKLTLEIVNEMKG